VPLAKATQRHTTNGINPDITRSNVIQKMHSIVNDAKYTGGFKGNMIFSIMNESFEALHYIRIL